jgi:hypothetical protein
MSAFEASADLSRIERILICVCRCELALYRRYLIGETVAFNTAHRKIKGARDPFGGFSNDADFIFIDGDKVSFYVAGVDFSATPYVFRRRFGSGRARLLTVSNCTFRSQVLDRLKARDDLRRSRFRCALVRKCLRLCDRTEKS